MYILIRPELEVEIYHLVHFSPLSIETSELQQHLQTQKGSQSYRRHSENYIL